jgi:hypothetical protein
MLEHGAGKVTAFAEKLSVSVRSYVICVSFCVPLAITEGRLQKMHADPLPKLIDALRSDDVAIRKDAADSLSRLGRKAKGAIHWPGTRSPA